MWNTWITIGVIALIIAGAISKIVREKKKGVKCIGCPAACSCARDNQSPYGNCEYHRNDDL